MKTSLTAAILALAGALSVGAAEPSRERAACEGLPAQLAPASGSAQLALAGAPALLLAAVNVWTPELPVIQPVSALAGDDPEYLADMLAVAHDYLGLRYRRGGKTPKGFDCSGFTGYVFGQFGIGLAASSAAQYRQGEPVADGDLRPGDLVFYSGRAGGHRRVGHVGMVTEVQPDGTFRFIHSSCSEGVVVTNSTAPYYLRRYVGARRVR